MEFIIVRIIKTIKSFVYNKISLILITIQNKDIRMPNNIKAIHNISKRVKFIYIYIYISINTVS